MNINDFTIPNSAPVNDNKVVLAFSGGLDTSFCVPYLIAQGYSVYTIFVDSGGVSDEEKQEIATKAKSLGAVKHHEADIGEALWHRVISPIIKTGANYQDQYPLLCSDRYLIVEVCLAYCKQLGTKNFAHGCTGMGNDQVRFDLAVHSLGDFKILSPIREIQKQTQNVRQLEEDYLSSLGHNVSTKVSNYSINENLLGATISGSEIDEWKAPADNSYVLTKPPHLQHKDPLTITLAFKEGSLVKFNNQNLGGSISGKSLIQTLNELGGNYGIGRGTYTGDTTIGLKGRIVFEAPAIKILQVAHKALEESTLTKSQNRFKPIIAKQWTELVYEGLYYDPLKRDLEAFINHSQTHVSGEVTVQLSTGVASAIAVKSENILVNQQSTYAQSADWTIDEALGFIKLFGQSTLIANQLNPTEENHDSH